MVSFSDFESWLALHVKRCKLKLIISTICLEIRNFLQTTPNIDNIYIKSNISKRPIETYYFQVLMTTEERETANESHGPYLRRAPPISPANHHPTPLKSCSSSTGHLKPAPYMPRKPWTATRRTRKASRGQVRPSSPLSSSHCLLVRVLAF